MVAATSMPNVAVGTNSLVARTLNPITSATVANSTGTPILPAACTADVRAVFPNPDGKLASGLYGLVGYPSVFPNSRQPNSVLVPAVSILRDLAGDFVWALDENNVVRRRGVESGTTVPRPASDPNAVPQRDMIILKGLTKEDRVIVSGLQRAREGATVAPEMADAEKPPTSPAPAPESKD